MICDECLGDISDGSPHFWGRYGGHWHPHCRYRLDSKLIVSVGMWVNTPDAFKYPEEYTILSSGLIGGLGI